jgi:hypothetical protein
VLGCPFTAVSGQFVSPSIQRCGRLINPKKHYLHNVSTDNIRAICLKYTAKVQRIPYHVSLSILALDRTYEGWYMACTDDSLSRIGRLQAALADLSPMFAGVPLRPRGICIETIIILPERWPVPTEIPMCGDQSLALIALPTDPAIDS